MVMLAILGANFYCGQRFTALCSPPSHKFFSSLVHEASSLWTRERACTPMAFFTLDAVFGKTHQRKRDTSGRKKKKKDTLACTLGSNTEHKRSPPPNHTVIQPKKKKDANANANASAKSTNKQISKQQQTKQGISTLLEQITGFSISFASGEKETRKVMVPIGRLDCSSWSNGAVRK